MDFESLMKIIEDEVNNKDYNSEIILTNTNTGKKLIIPKSKPVNFFNIPNDVRKIIYNKVRNFKKYDKYKSLDQGHYCIGELVKTYNLQLKKPVKMEFIDSDDEQEEQNFNDLYNTIDEIDKLKDKSKDKNLLSFKSGVIERLEEIQYNNNKRKIIINYKILYDKRVENIKNFINNLNDDEYIKYKYNNYEILDSYSKIFDEGLNLKYKSDYLELYKIEFGEDEKIKKIINDYKIEYDEKIDKFVDSYGECLRKERDIKILKEKYNEKFRLLFFETIYKN